MIQMTWIHRLLWGLLSLGGTLNERSLSPLLQWLIDRGKPQLALEIARIFLNDLLMTWNIIHVTHVRKWKEYYELLSYSDTMNMTIITGKVALKKQRNVVFFTQNKFSRLVT